MFPLPEARLAVIIRVISRSRALKFNLKLVIPIVRKTIYSFAQINITLNYAAISLSISNELVNIAARKEDLL